MSETSRTWASTMAGHPVTGRDGRELRMAHAAAGPRVGAPRLLDRTAREELEDAVLSPGATRSRGAGHRAAAEEPDALRTCFERDRDRILHSTAFRRLAGKTQVFVHPEDHQRTRLTHALEVAQVATAVGSAVGLNVVLLTAMSWGHDVGHTPGAHAGETALATFVPDFHHARWGADVVLAPLNLCAETLDGVRCHSWSLPTPSTPEGQVLSWADRIAYCTHDLEDAVSAGLVRPDDLPAAVTETAGTTRSDQLNTFISALVDGITNHGVVGMDAGTAAALAALREFNYQRIYMRPESVAQSRAVVNVLRALVEYYAEDPARVASDNHPDAEPLQAAVAYVAGMTDRFAFQAAVELLGWRTDRLPRGIDSPYAPSYAPTCATRDHI